MDKMLFEQLNQVYAPLYDRAAGLTRVLNQAGYQAQWGWYACHSVLVEGEYRTERFPIPVVTVEGLCDVGVDLDQIFLEFQLPRETALRFDYSQLPEGFEAYGVEDYLHDFYHPGMDLEGIGRRVRESGERAVGVQLTFPPDVPDERLTAAVERCRQWQSNE